MSDQHPPLKTDFAASPDRCVSEFRRLWDVDRLTVEQFLDQHAIDRADQSTLIRLIQTEIELARRDNRSTDRDEYAKRFPDIPAKLLADLFLMPVPPPSVAQKPILPSPYKVGHQIGKGGIGSVWQVFDRRMERPLAAKVLHKKYRDNPAANLRLEREARLTGILQHPGIPPIYDIGQLVSGSKFFVMKLVEGKTLHQILETRDQSELTVHELLGIFDHIAQTMAYAHSQNIVHRDIKPQNVMVGKFGEIQVMDWGMAKPLRPDNANLNSASELQEPASVIQPMDRNETAMSSLDSSMVDPMRSMTIAGDLFGTPAYMPPEQARGDIAAIGPSSDVFSLGAILFEILTGKRLHADTPTVELVSKAASGDLSSCLVELEQCDADDTIKLICKRCLAEDPDDRPQDGSVVADEITEYLTDVQARLKQLELEQAQSEVKILEERKRRKLSLAFAGMVVVAAVIAVAAMFWYQLDKARQQKQMDQQRANLLCDALIQVPALAVPLAIDNLKPLAEYALPVLETKFNDTELSDARRLRAAMAIAHFGVAKEKYFVDWIETLPNSESNNLVLALQNQSLDVVKPLIDQAILDQYKQLEVERVPLTTGWIDTTPNQRKARRYLARLAIVAMWLGDSSHALDMLAVPDKDSSQRSAFIDTCAQWHGNLEVLEEHIYRAEDPVVCSGFIMSIAEIVEALPPERRFFSPNLVVWLERQYVESPSLVIRNSAKILLERWKIALPETPVATADVENRDWYHNSAGITMRYIAGGSFRNQRHDEYETTITKPYFIADHPTTVDQFREFIATGGLDPTNRYAANFEEQTRSNNGLRYIVDDVGQYAVQNINWFSAVRYCNWLSQKEGLTPAYVITDEKVRFGIDFGAGETLDWRLDPDANGYRLPYSAEWELACRAETFTYYSFGDDRQLMKRFGKFFGNTNGEEGEVAVRLPNHWGMFDIHGGTVEWCQDYEVQDREYLKQNLVDPTGAETGDNKVTRNGYVLNRAHRLSSGYFSRRLRSNGISFRVARWYLPQDVEAGEAKSH